MTGFTWVMVVLLIGVAVLYAWDAWEDWRLRKQHEKAMRQWRELEALAELEEEDYQ